MIFESLYESALRGELILIDGGYCRYRLRRDGQVTIYEIISLRRGAGSEMLERLKDVPSATSILAKCPTDLVANAWYKRKGFTLEETQTTRSSRVVNVWRLQVPTK